ncbi:MAG: XrtA/PEP-CTERM system histidine kinase PrsK [Chthoniobacteraceae bacterium]
MPSSVLAFVSATVCGLVAIAAVLRKWRSAAAWSFCAGMAAFAFEAAADGLSLRAIDAGEVNRWQALASIARSLVPGTWMLFSLTYSRGNYVQFVLRWRLVLAAAFVLPIGIALGFHGSLSEAFRHKESHAGWWLEASAAGKLLSGLLLLSAILVMTNLENTLRAAVGTMRWRIKFVVLGLGVIFGARIYTTSQEVLFSGWDLALAEVDTASLLIGCFMIGVAYVRSGFAEIDVYPSRTVLASSVTALLAGVYLFVIGVAAQVVGRLGGGVNFQTQAFLVLAGVAVLAVLLLSDRLRQGVRRFVSRHFARPQHDSRRIWSLATTKMASVLNPAGLCGAAARLVSETFEVLAVSIWLVDDRKHQLVLAASTSSSDRNGQGLESACPASESMRSGLAEKPGPFDLEKVTDERLRPLQQLCVTQFAKGGNRVCLPLFAAERWLGVAVLADRVNGVPYTVEELDLLKCIGDQLAAAVLNLRLTDDLMQSKELEAFQTMSTFFVHDLKNAVSGLSLTLRNLPVHFDDPEFRADALRGIGNTVSRIDGMIERLSALRKKIEPRFEVADLNQLVRDTLQRIDGMKGVDVKTDLQPLPKVLVDREQIESVLTNLLLNARDALAAGGQIEVRSGQEDGRAVLTVSDTGAGMSAEFLRNSLFRPFQSTKKKGLGIGMFQSKTIVEAHRGTIQVESEMGKGTTFRIHLPPSPQAS